MTSFKKFINSIKVKISSIQKGFWNKYWSKKPFLNLPVKLKKNKTYIFFHWQGLAHFIALFLIFPFCINYSNNLGIASICFLGLTYITGLFRNHYALKTIEVFSITHLPHEEQNEGIIVFTFKNNKKNKKSFPICYLEIENEKIPVYFDKNGEGVAKWKYFNKGAGVFFLPVFKIFTLWPLSITKTWANIKLDKKISVIPTSKHATIDGKMNDSSSNSSITSFGDVSGIRNVNKDERPDKISWKSTIKYGKLMTYTYEGANVLALIINWPKSKISDMEKIRLVKSEIDYAVNNKIMFKIVHPKFHTNLGSGKTFGLHSLGLLMQSVIPAKNWDEN